MKSYKRLVKLTDISNVTELLGSEDMAMSKVKSEKFPILERINKLDYASNIERRIVDDEIDIFCVQEEKKAMSVENIYNILGGPHSHYKCMELENSFECYQFCRDKMIQYLQNSNKEILFFEDRKTLTDNVIVAVTRKENHKENIFLHCVIRMTIFSSPKVGFCRYFLATGIACYIIFHCYKLLKLKNAATVISLLNIYVMTIYL